MQNVGQLIQELRDLKQEITNQNAVLKELGEQRDEKEAALRRLMEETGTTQISNGKDSVFLTENIVPQAVDWHAFNEYVHDNNAYYLYERRISSSAYRELRDQGVEIPGVNDFVKPTISLRKK
jgi:hypothetical protein